jgi:hypothetical protein
LYPFFEERFSMLTALFAANEPAGGAATDQIVIATAGALVATSLLLWLVAGHRSGRVQLLGRVAAFSERIAGIPGWAALPAAVGAVSLLVALLGMYWDIALHIDVGRDEGPLANPAHYLILAGLGGVFAAGVLAMALPKGERPGRSAIRITRDWYAPIGGVLMAACGAFALLGFPLDDVWHRLFGQDVTLWGPTHLMLIGGAGLSLIGQAVLLAEGVQARGPRVERDMPLATAFRRVGMMGGLLIGLSTFQAEFDFGVPQFRFVFEPLLIALAASIALVTARLWIGRGGAVAAVAFFLVVRGLVALLVGPVFGETTPHLPLYLGSAVCVEVAAGLLRARSPITFGAVAGVLVGTVGFASEWAWSQFAMPLPWTEDILVEGLALSLVAGVAGGVLGGLMGSALRGELPRPGVARPAAVAAVAAVMVLVGNGLVTEPPDEVRATVELSDAGGSGGGREVNATVRIDPPSAAEDAAWLTMTAWQGDGFHLDELEPAGEPGLYRTTEPVPVHGDWKALVRLHRDRSIAGIPVYLPEDTAIPAPAVPAESRFERSFVTDKEILQREQKEGVAGWLKVAAPLVVLGIALSLLLALCWGLGRVGTGGREPEPPSRRGRPGVASRPAAAS